MPLVLPQAVGQTPVPAGGGSRQTHHGTPAACRNRTRVTSVGRHPHPGARHRHPSLRQWRSRPPLPRSQETCVPPHVRLTGSTTTRASSPRSRRAKRRRSTVWGGRRTKVSFSVLRSPIRLKSFGSTLSDLASFRTSSLWAVSPWNVSSHSQSVWVSRSTASTLNPSSTSVRSAANVRSAKMCSRRHLPTAL